MQRIPVLIKKISDLSQAENNTAIDVDLMLDYTRVLYADLLEWKAGLSIKPVSEPTLAEMANAMEQAQSSGKTPASTTIPSETKPLDQANEQLAMPAYTQSTYSKQLETGIQNNIGINDKYLFISELFGNNKEVYDEVLSELNHFETYEQAVQWIKAYLFSQYHWDEENDTVQLFYGILRKFFSER